MKDFDRTVKFIQNNDFAIVVFNKNAKELYKRIREKFDCAYINYNDFIGLRFDFYTYKGYSIYPVNCYDISDDTGYYEGQEYAVLSFDKRASAKVV